MLRACADLGKGSRANVSCTGTTARDRNRFPGIVREEFLAAGLNLEKQASKRFVFATNHILPFRGLQPKLIGHHLGRFFRRGDGLLQLIQAGLVQSV